MLGEVGAIVHCHKFINQELGKNYHLGTVYELAEQAEKIYCKESPLTAYGWGNISFKNNKLSFLNIEDILPVKKIQFENYDFYTMNNIDKYLTDFYGEYMSIPVNMEIAKYTTRYKKFMTSGGSHE